MPEAAVDEDHCPVAWQDEVWGTWQVASVQSESVPKSVHNGTDG